MKTRNIAHSRVDPHTKDAYFSLSFFQTSDENKQIV